MTPFFARIEAFAEAFSVSAKSAILIEAESGTVLYQKNAFVKLPMASTTKIMTALVAIESGDVDRLVKTDDRARGVEGSSIYLAEGETLSMRHLLYALMLASANDAAVAIAYEVAGSIEDFAALMNAKASELGLTSTSFKNPHGLHHEEHYTTAHDLARLTSAALENEIFIEICSTKSQKIPLNGEEGTRYLTNHNKLLRLYKGCIGVKTGYTKTSGRCLVSAAERDGLRLIAVTLNAPNDWRDHTAMLDFGFNNYQRLTLVDSGELITTLPVAGSDTLLKVCAAQQIFLFLPKNGENIFCKVEINRPLFAPIRKNAVVGRIIYTQNGKTIASAPLTAANDIKAKTRKTDLLGWIKKLFIKN